MHYFQFFYLLVPDYFRFPGILIILHYIPHSRIILVIIEGIGLSQMKQLHDSFRTIMHFICASIFHVPSALYLMYQYESVLGWNHNWVLVLPIEKLNPPPSGSLTYDHTWRGWQIDLRRHYSFFLGVWKLHHWTLSGWNRCPRDLDRMIIVFSSSSYRVLIMLVVVYGK